jgi:uncharacterized repeat protein (TIGR02543 family)
MKTRKSIAVVGILAVLAVFGMVFIACSNPTSSTIPDIIDIAAITGIAAPVAGAVPVTTITETEQYTGTVTWNPNDNPFETGTAYTATITLMANIDFTLQGVTTNFFTVAGAITSNAANSGVVTAVFPATGINFSVTFNSNGGSTVASQTINDGSKATEPQGVSKEGHTLDGWYQDNNTFNNKWNFTTSTVTTDINLYAKWNPITYMVRYDKNANDASGIMTDSSHTYNVERNLTTNSFTRKGYTFTGWNTQTNGSGTNYADGQNVKNLTATTETIFTLYAQWVITSTMGDFKITGTNLSGISYASPILTINESGTYAIYMRDGITSTNTDRIVVASGVNADITLFNVKGTSKNCQLHTEFNKIFCVNVFMLI